MRVGACGARIQGPAIERKSARAWLHCDEKDRPLQRCRVVHCAQPMDIYSLTHTNSVPSCAKFPPTSPSKPIMHGNNWL